MILVNVGAELQRLVGCRSRTGKQVGMYVKMGGPRVNPSPRLGLDTHLPIVIAAMKGE